MSSDSEPAPHLQCTVLTAGPGDVNRAYSDLNRDMDPRFVHVFLDKLQRYAAKPDRALFLAEYQQKIIAFATIIDHSPVPDDSGSGTAEMLKDHACGTGLMVMPEFRRRGVATALVQQWEHWARENHRHGVWLVTRRMADWYQRCFSFSSHEIIIRHGVQKTILLKTFPLPTAP